ncbi:MAG: glycosyltransferase family 2 protein [Bacteroidota bacterium]|uniref:glycosyltransferase family 2 protein n=1 Tax=Leeuwenhoekiella palythoae TaxID=573501 RepID=UPI002E8D79A4|nr:glycosyltransferase family 2 protein [Bacteroidota bacterium]MEE3226119.1 glycosyltransferase family 2 protein [Bacteroidota bacterium]
MQGNPLVSIIIPTYNRAHLIGETLDSVLAQTYTHWECIVVDDGSTDGTDEVLATYVEKDSRFQYHHRPKDRPKGANVCRNYGFELSKGKYIQWLDSDDLIGQEKIDEQVTILEQNRGLLIATCKWDYFSDSSGLNDIKEELRSVYGSFCEMKDFLEQLAQSGGFFPPHAYLLPRKIVHDSGNWLEYLQINQDGEYFSRIFLRSQGVLFSERSKVYYRLAIASNVSVISNKKKMTQAVDSWKLIEANFVLRFGSATNLVQISKKYLVRRISELDHDFIRENRIFFYGDRPKTIANTFRKIKNKLRFKF